MDLIGKALYQKALREAKHTARSKAEKQKRDLDEEHKALKHGMLDSLDITAAQHEPSAKREQELATLKKLEEDTLSHKITITEMRHKNSQVISIINEQIESLKKSKSQLEKTKQTLEAEHADLPFEFKSYASSKSELEMKRKIAESQLVMGDSRK